MKKYLTLLGILVASYASSFECEVSKIYDGKCITKKSKVKFRYIGSKDGDVYLLYDIDYVSPASSNSLASTIQFLDKDGFSWHEETFQTTRPGVETPFNNKGLLQIPDYAWDVAAKTNIIFPVKSD